MSSSSGPLRFSFPAHGDQVLCRMNALREHRSFCDVTLLLGAGEAPRGGPLRFHGHRVVLAASSDFLRDQFLLHEGRAELSVGVVASVEVGRRLLLSCYTGLLEVPLRELVSYLTAASALQMGQVVEKCAQAVSRYLSPTLAFLKPETPSEEKEGTRLRSREETDAAQPSTSSQGAGSRVDKAGREGLKREEVEVKTEPEAGGDVQAALRRHLSHQVHHVTGTLRAKPRPSAAFRDHISSTSVRSPAPDAEAVDSSQDRDEQEEEEEEEEMLSLQDGRELVDFCLSPGLLGADAGGVLVERPYLCRRCDRVFQHLESYVGHLKEHRQYLCLVCEKSFSQKSNLTRHIRVHTGVKNFRCPLCHKTFSQKATLQDHLNVHTGDKPHKCNYCAVHFSHKPGLRRHLKVIHGKSSLQNVLEEPVD